MCARDRISLLELQLIYTGESVSLLTQEFCSRVGSGVIVSPHGYHRRVVTELFLIMILKGRIVAYYYRLCKMLPPYPPLYRAALSSRAMQMIVADIAVANGVWLLKRGGHVTVPPSMFEAYPNLVALTESILAEPSISDFIAKTETSK